MNKDLTMLDILNFESSNKKKDKELQKLWEKKVNEFCKLCKELLKVKND